MATEGSTLCIDHDTLDRINPKTQRMKTKVLIVDDHPTIRLGLRSLLSNEGDFEICGEAASIPEAFQMANSLKPDVAIIDLTLDGSRGGLELVQQLSDNIKILVCSYHDEKIFAERALSAGARGYIQKDEELDSVVDALRQIIADDIYLSPRMSQHLLKQIGKKAQDKVDGPFILKLSNREIDVLQLLGQGYEIREIAKNLHLSPKTIAKHCENIMSKLGLESMTKLRYHAILWVREAKGS